MNKKVLRQFSDLLKEVATGEVEIETAVDFNEYDLALVYMKMHYQIIVDGKKYSNVENPDDLVLKIDNYEKFLNLLEELIEIRKEFHIDESEMFSQKGYDKAILVSNFLNMTEEDLSNPIKYLQDYIKTYKEPKLSSVSEMDIGKININGQDYDITMNFGMNEHVLETPYSYTFSINNKKDWYYFPTIYAAKVDDRLIIRAIQRRLSSDEKIGKEIDKYIKEGIPKVGSNKHLRNVSPCFVVALNMFINNYIKITGSKIKYIEFPVCTPFRYQNKLGCYQADALDELSADEELTDDLKLELQSNFEKVENRVNDIQTNITDKFINTALRLEYHCDEFEVFDYGDTGSYFILKYNPDKKKSNEFFDKFCNMSLSKNK